MKKGWKLKKRGDKPIWDEYVNEETGESTTEIHDKKTLIDSSKCKHHYEPIDSLGNVICRRCQIGTRMVRGIHELKDGSLKVIKR
jgi:hypothetical protein